MQINHPQIPYCGPIGTRLTPGSLIRITGTVSSSATCFSINLQCGPSVNPRDDVALHLSPVFSPPPRIVRNSIAGNRWGGEESFGGFPISRGSSFEFMILVESSEYRIALNGNHFTEFRHRMPIDRVTHLSIDGEVQIDLISVTCSSAPSYDTPYAAGPPPPYGPPIGGGAAPPYPIGFAAGAGDAYPSVPYSQDPYPSKPSMYPYVPGTESGPYPATGAYPVPPATGSYPAPPSASHQPYPAQAPMGAYPAAGGQIVYPPTGGGGYVPQSQSGYPPASSNKSSGIGGMLSGLTTGIAATSIGSALMGHGKHNKNKHGHHQQDPYYPQPGMVPGAHNPGKKSSGIPIAGLAAGAGAAALGAAMLSGHLNPMKKAKKMFKHKHKYSHHHRGWGSSSSSSSSEEE